MFKRNSFFSGFVIGIIIPVIIFIILYGINYLTGIFNQSPIILSEKKMMFISTALNIIPFRYFFKKGGWEETGKGILFITVVLILIITLVF